MTIESFDKGGVRGFLHRPEGGNGRGLVLTHGAGGNCQMSLLVAVATAFSAAGFTVLRIDLPFRQRRQNGPPHPSGAAADRAGLYDAVLALRPLAAARIALAGQSYGGRQASMLAADIPDLIFALLLFSYPLHPPGRPEQRRTEHFPRLRVPSLFVSGTRDAFGTTEELTEAISQIPAPARLLPIEGAGHDLRRGRFDFAAVIAAFQELPFGQP